MCASPLRLVIFCHQDQETKACFSAFSLQSLKNRALCANFEGFDFEVRNPSQEIRHSVLCSRAVLFNTLRVKQSESAEGALKRVPVAFTETAAFSRIC
jgi:hypothetical protein